MLTDTENDLRSKLHRAVQVAVEYHVPQGKDYLNHVKICSCGHMTDMGRLDGRTAHIASSVRDAIDEVFREEEEMSDRDL